MASDDSLLLSAVGRGDRQALERIYHEHKAPLLTAAIYLLAGDRPAAEDVLHDVFVALAERAAQVSLSGSLRNYLLSCCLNRARSVLRKRRERALEPSQLSDLAGTCPPPEEGEIALTIEEVTMALSQLSDEQREVVTLHIHGGLTFREIAEMLEISSNTAQSRYRYALSNLRKQLARTVVPRKD